MTLHVLHPDPTTPPPDRGRLLTPDEVAELIGGVSAAWVRGSHRVGKDQRPREPYSVEIEGKLVTRERRVGEDKRPTAPNVPHKIALGHSTVRWYEQDVRAWLESRRAAS